MSHEDGTEGDDRPRRGIRHRARPRCVGRRRRAHGRLRVRVTDGRGVREGLEKITLAGAVASRVPLLPSAVVTGEDTAQLSEAFDDVRRGSSALLMAAASAASLAFPAKQREAPIPMGASLTAKRGSMAARVDPRQLHRHVLLAGVYLFVVGLLAVVCRIIGICLLVVVVPCPCESDDSSARRPERESGHEDPAVLVDGYAARCDE